MCDVHGVFGLRALHRSAFLILLGTYLTVCAQAQQAPAGQAVPAIITCISKQGERQACKADTTAGVVLMRSIGESPCLLGKNWGYDDAGVWVSNGCSGEFGVGKQEASAVSKAQAQQAPAGQSVPTVITCISKQGERQVCKADTTAGVVLVRSIGESECLLGKNWGYEDAGVWVSNGCSGEFRVGKEEASTVSKFVGMFEPYGQLRTHLAAFQDTEQVQDNASRIGINFSTLGKIKMFATTEWGVNLVGSETQFNLSSQGPGDFGVVTTDINQVFTARLGFIGIDTGPFGRVAIGKQYAVHYDVAGYTTDRFNVFGGQGTFAYPAGTDGGVTGTGRADRVVQYRNTFLKILEVGVQGQFRGDANGVGASLQIKILPGVKVGGAYTRTDWAPATQQLVRGLGGNADYVAVGTRIEWRTLELGFVYAHQHNGDVAFIPVPNAPNLFTPVAWSGPGVEFYSHLGLGKFGLIGGFTYQGPNVNDPLLNPDFKTQYLILGGEWFLVRKAARIYTESRIDLGSTTATGEPGYNVFTIGFRYDFSLRFTHQP